MRFSERDELLMLEMSCVGRERERRSAMSVLWMERRVVCSAEMGWLVGGTKVSRYVSSALMWVDGMNSRGLSDFDAICPASERSAWFSMVT